MAEHEVRHWVMSVQLPVFLRDIYEGKLLLPDVPQEPWDDARRLRLFEGIYRRLPAGSVVVWRTSQHLECRNAIGPVPLREPAETQIHDYLIDGIGLAEVLFQELGQALWSVDGPGQRRLAVSENPTTSVTFDLSTQTFRISRAGDELLPSEFALSRLMDAGWQHAFAAVLNPQLQNRFSRLVDTFFEALVTVIQVVSEDPTTLQDLLAARGTELPRHILEQVSATLRWYCDTCGEAIRHSRDGWVEWLIRSEGQSRIGRGLRLVHHLPASPRPQGCQYDDSQEYQRDQSSLHDLPLEDFLGHDGLTYLLEILSQGELPQEQVVELTKRLHTPGYERARFHVKDAIAEGVIEPNTARGFYSQSDIAEVLRWADEHHRKP